MVAGFETAVNALLAYEIFPPHRMSAHICTDHGSVALGATIVQRISLRLAVIETAVRVVEFERDGEILRVDPTGPLVVRIGAAADLAVSASIAGLGIVHLFEEWLRPHLDSGALEPVLTPWWQSFPGPFLYDPGRRHLPAPLRAFVDFIKS